MVWLMWVEALDETSSTYQRALGMSRFTLEETRGPSSVPSVRSMATSLEDDRSREFRCSSTGKLEQSFKRWVNRAVLPLGYVNLRLLPLISTSLVYRSIGSLCLPLDQVEVGPSLY